MAFFDYKGYLLRKKFQEEGNIRQTGSRTVLLPEIQWRKCASCGGTKSYLESGDAHRSEGMVPCYRCDHDGIVRKVTRPVYRVRARSK